MIVWSSLAESGYLAHGTGFALIHAVSKLPHIDAIRGVAILMVVFVHAAQAHGKLGTSFDLLARYGQMGVQLFFVASAYTLCLSAERRATETQPLLKYTLRRFFRLAPMYYVGIVLYAGLAFAGAFAANPHAPVAADYTSANVAANVLLLHGSYAPGNNVIVPGGWSIGTEVAFYAVFPLLFAGLRRVGHSGLSRLIFVLAAVASSQGLLLLVAPFGGAVDNGNFYYYHLVTQLPVFAIGMAYYFAVRTPRRRYSVAYDLVAVAVLSLGAVGLWGLYIGHLYSVIPIVSGLSFVALVEVYRKVPGLSVPWLTRLGQVSYSVYIVHFAVVWALSEYAGAGLAEALGAVPSIVVVFVLGAAGASAVALLTERFVERPAARLGCRLAARLDAGGAFAKTARR